MLYYFPNLTKYFGIIDRDIRITIAYTIYLFKHSIRILLQLWVGLPRLTTVIFM